jgi:aryl sulfotransferase
LHAMLAAQTHRRFIKTHTPLDGVPYFPQCTYLIVHRDPRDTYFSMRNHAANMQSEQLLDRLIANVREGFLELATRSYAPGEFDNFAAAANVHHYQSYKRFEDLANFHFSHYANLKQDLRGSIAAMAAALGLSPSHKLLDEVTAAVGFDAMKANARKFAPNAGRGVWKDDSQFFNKGQSQQWRTVLNDEDLAIYDSRLAELLPKADIAWLQNGESRFNGSLLSRSGRGYRNC